MKTKNKSAFTLVELLVVIAIIAILSTLAIVSLQQARKSARDAKRISDIRQIQTALELFYNSWGEYPNDLTSGEEMASGGIIYMHKIPSAPFPADNDCENASNAYNYATTSSGGYVSSYTISFCLGGQVGSLSAGGQTATPAGISSNLVSAWSCGENLTYQGHDYTTVQIGNQCWFAENLKYIPNGEYFSSSSEVSAYCDHDGCPSPGGWWCSNSLFCQNQGGQWIDDGSPHYYIHSFEGGSIEDGKLRQNYIDYGILYNWYAIDQESLCPNGWHVSSKNDIDILIDYLGGESVAGEKMKVDASHYIPWNGTNSSGFSSLPGGSAYISGSLNTTSFSPIGNQGYFHLSSSFNTFKSYSFYMYGYDNYIYVSSNIDKASGFSVRCVKD